MAGQLPRRFVFKIILLTIAGLFVFTAIISGWIESWLWMLQVGYQGIFWTLLSVQCEMFLAAFGLAFL